jgi:hypothetical protein
MFQAKSYSPVWMRRHGIAATLHLDEIEIGAICFVVVGVALALD